MKANLGRWARGFSVAAALLLVLTPAGGVAEESSPAHEFCRMTSASDPVAFQTCVDQQILGAQSIVRYLKWAQSTGGPSGERVLRVLDFCRDRWIPDHQLIDNCLRARALIPPP